MKRTGTLEVPVSVVGSASTGSAQAAGVGGGESTAVAMGLQARALMAEVEKTEAEAGLAQAQATSISGVETQAHAKDLAVKDSIENLNRINATLSAMKTSLTSQQIDEVKVSISKITEEVNGLKIDNSIKRKPKKR